MTDATTTERPLKPGDAIELTDAGRKLFKHTPDRRGVVFRAPHDNLVSIKWDAVKSRHTIHVAFVQRIEPDVGDRCGQGGCKGSLNYAPDGPCICAVTRPPCWACENSKLACETCGATP